MLNKKIKYSIDILILSFILINPVNAKQPNLELNWELDGLHNPESAVYDPVLNHLYVSNVDGSPIDTSALITLSRIGLPYLTSPIPR